MQTLDPLIAEPNVTAIENLEYWINERDMIRKLRDEGVPPPWSDDPVFCAHNFAHVVWLDDRDNDLLIARVQETARNTREAVLLDAIGRLCPEALDARPLPYDPNRVFRILRDLEATGGRRSTGHPRTLAFDILGGLWSDPPRVDTGSMQRTYYALQGRVGPLTATMMTADLRHILPGGWHDRNLWAPVGPAVIRTLRRIYGDAPSKSRHNLFLLRTMDILRERGKTDPLPRMEMMDLQKCLSEYDRYERFKHD